MRASDQILEYLDGPKREDKYHRTELDNMRLGDVTTDQLQHYLACRRVMEEHLDEETVFDELCRLSRLADEETTDAFAWITLGGKREPTIEERLLRTAQDFRMWFSDEYLLGQDLAWKLIRLGYSCNEAEDLLRSVGVEWTASGTKAA